EGSGRRAGRYACWPRHHAARGHQERAPLGPPRRAGRSLRRGALQICGRQDPPEGRRDHPDASGQTPISGGKDVPVTRSWSMIRIKKIDHVAVCVSDLDAAVARYREVFGLEPTDRETVESQKTEAALLPVGDSSLELITPKGGNPGLERFLE